MKKYNLKDIFYPNIINEKSFIEKDIPKFFYLVTSFSNEDFAKQIANKKLEGVVGISENKLIIPSFVGKATRNTILIMPGKELVNNNNLTKILYHNINYLLSNNMKILYRIYDYEYNAYGKLTIMNFIKINLNRYYNQTNGGFNPYLDYFMNKLYENAWKPEVFYYKSNFKINNIYDLAKFLYRSAMDFNPEKAKYISYKDFVEPITGAFKIFNHDYNTEGEWIIKNKTLNIPNNSKLIFVVDNNKKDLYIRDTIKQYNLDKLYNIIFIDKSQFERLRNKLR